MGRYEVVELTVRDVKFDDMQFNVIHANTDDNLYIRFHIHIPKATMTCILDAIKEYNLRPNLVISSMVSLNNTTSGKISKSDTIKTPRIVDGKLTSKDIPVSDNFTLENTTFRGVCNVNVVLTIRECLDEHEVVSIFIRSITPTERSLRYMGDEVFPDCLTGIENVSNTELNEFMDTY